MTVEILIFVTPTCPSCKPVFDKIDRVVEEIKKEINSTIEIKKMDVTEKENLNIALKYNVKTVPTLVINGSEIIKGAPEKDELVEIIKKHLKS